MKVNIVNIVNKVNIVFNIRDKTSITLIMSINFLYLGVIKVRHMVLYGLYNAHIAHYLKNLKQSSNEIWSINIRSIFHHLEGERPILLNMFLIRTDQITWSYISFKFTKVFCRKIRKLEAADLYKYVSSTGVNLFRMGFFRGCSQMGSPPP